MIQEEKWFSIIILIQQDKYCLLSNINSNQSQKVGIEFKNKNSNKYFFICIQFVPNYIEQYDPKKFTFKYKQLGNFK